MSEALILSMKHGALLVAACQLVFSIIQLPKTLEVCDRFSHLWIVLFVNIYMILKHALIGAALGLLYHLVLGHG